MFINLWKKIEKQTIILAKFDFENSKTQENAQNYIAKFLKRQKL